MIVICGKDTVRGVRGDDSPDLNTYFELGWETIITHLMVKYWALRNIISRESTIVTCDSRQFLYNAMFPNVITWQQFVEKYQYKGLLQSGIVIDLPAMVLQAKSVEQIATIKSLLTPDDIQEIQRISVQGHSNLSKIDSDYACMVIRKRNHCSDRDLPEEYLWKLIREALNRYPRLYIMGKDVGHYCNIDPARMEHVSLHEFSILIGGNRCKRVIGPLSGGMAVNCIYGNAPATFIDAANERHNYFDNHPLMFGECVNLAGIHMNHIKVTEDWERVFNG
jgi:hypothetical protein